MVRWSCLLWLVGGSVVTFGCGSGDDYGTWGDGGSGGAPSSGGAASIGGAASAGGGTGSTSTGSMSTGSMSTGTGMDPYADARTACIDKINELRATKNLPPYSWWAGAESCADQQATHDEMNNSPHGAWSQGLYPSCNGSGQNECLGAGPGGIEACLESMWAEKDQAGCAGCDACNAAYDPDCPNCDFFGTETGDVCGHYVNMSALYFSQAVCGFSSLGGWDVINFQ